MKDVSSSSAPARSSHLRALDAAGLWVIADQGVASIGNFLTGNLLARHLMPQSQYGAWGLILETMFFLNSLQSALVNYPMTLESTLLDRKGPRRAATAALLFTAALLPVLGLGMFCAAGSTAGMAIGGIAVVAMLLWQAQETLRRSLIAVLRVAECIPGDAISYLGQALGVYLLILTGRLTLCSALLVVAGTSAAAIVVQATQTGLARLEGAHIRQLARKFWSLGRWNVLAALTTVITSVSYPWILRWGRGSGLDAVAVLMAISVPMKLTNPVMNSIGGLLVPAVSHQLRDHGPRAAIRPALRYGGIGLLLLMPCYALAICAPAFVLRIVFGSASPYVHAAGLLRIWAFSWAASYLSVVMGSALLGLRQSRLHFAGQVLHATAAACIALPAGYFFGVRGLVIGAIITSCIDLMVGTLLVRYAVRIVSPGSVGPDEPEIDGPAEIPSPNLGSMPSDIDPASTPMPASKRVASSVG